MGVRSEAWRSNLKAWGLGVDNRSYRLQEHETKTQHPNVYSKSVLHSRSLDKKARASTHPDVISRVRKVKERGKEQQQKTKQEPTKPARKPLGPSTASLPPPPSSLLSPLSLPLFLSSGSRTTVRSQAITLARAILC